MKINKLFENKKRGSLVVDPVERLIESLKNKGIIELNDDDETTEWYTLGDYYLMLFEQVRIHVLVHDKANNTWLLVNPDEYESRQTHAFLTRTNYKGLELFKGEGITLESLL